MSDAALTGLDKAAILFQVLGDGLSVTIFKELDDAQLRQVRRRAREITGVPWEVKRAILEEFYFGFLTEKFRETGEDSRRPFAFLDKLSDAQVAYLILGESSVVMAMVLAQLTPERQMKVFEQLDQDERIEALTALGESEAMNLEAVVSVAGNLEERARYLPKGTTYERGGGEKLAGMLNGMPLDQATLYLGKLSQENPELFKEVKRYYITFDDIFKLPDGVMRDILNSVELDDIAMAMKGVDEATVDRAIGVLPKKKQAMFEPIEGPASKRDVDGARAKIMAQVRRMQTDGEINVADILSGEVVE